MPRPIETLLSLPRVRLINRVPILETGKYVRRFVGQPAYHPKLVKQAMKVSEGSAQQFSVDDEGLAILLEEIDSAEYVVTNRSKRIMQEMLNGICADGFIFKEFEGAIHPLCEISPPLRQVSKMADGLADKAKEETIDVARALLIDLPTHTSNLRFQAHQDAGTVGS
jgi:hypothetical protein